MFERLFQRPFALNPHLNGPLVEERRRFLCHRADQGIGRITAPTFCAMRVPRTFWRKASP